MKMTKQVQKMVQEVNARMREHHIKDESDPVFATMQWLLLRSDCYAGFNYFTENGKLSGGNNEKFDHLEFYTR